MAKLEKIEWKIIASRAFRNSTNKRYVERILFEIDLIMYNIVYQRRQWNFFSCKLMTNKDKKDRAKKMDVVKIDLKRYKQHEGWGQDQSEWRNGIYIANSNTVEIRLWWWWYSIWSIIEQLECTDLYLFIYSFILLGRGLSFYTTPLYICSRNFACIGAYVLHLTHVESIQPRVQHCNFNPAK